MSAVGVGRGRQLQDKARIEAAEGISRRVRIGLVSFVDQDHGTDQPQDIAQALLNGKGAGHDALLPTHLGQIVDVQVAHYVEQLLVGLAVVLGREKGGEPAAVAEEAQRLFGLPGGGGKHQ